MTDICKGCTKPILSGEARYTGKEPDECWHFDCHDQRRKAAQPKLGDVVIQLETVGLGGSSWIDLNVTNSSFEATGLARELARQKKGRKVRVVKVLYV